MDLDPHQMTKVSSIYSYKDGPSPPMTRGLVIIAIAPTSLSIVRKLELLDDTNDNNNTTTTTTMLHKATIAVKRGDGDFGRQLSPHDVINSQRFAQLVCTLHRHEWVAIVQADKYGRFGILVPTSDTTHSTTTTTTTTSLEDYQGQDFAAVLYSGTLETVQTYLTHELTAAVPSSTTMAVVPQTPPYPPPPPQSLTTTTTTTTNDNDTMEWQPSTPPYEPPHDPSTPTYEPPCKDTTTTSSGLWQPPTDHPYKNDNGDGLWQPPKRRNETIGDDGDDGLWQPPTTGHEDDPFGTNNNNNNETWQVERTTTGKRKRDNEEYYNDKEEEDDENENKGENTFHTDSGAAAADAFYSGLTRSLDTRADSYIFHMRAFNGWVKATQIQELNPKTKVKGSRRGDGKLRILDLACGKGGDLGKWVLHPRGIDNYVGIDVARGSLRDAAERARKMSRLSKCTFTCADLGSDVPGRLRSKSHKHLQKLLTWSLQNESPHESGTPNFQMVRGGGISLEDRFDVVSIQFAIHYMMSSR